jgi:histidyl-tRNA synthetase
MSQKPSLPQGTRDFSPIEMARRRYIFATAEKAFRSYGFHQIETPAMEQLSTLTGKYGEEGDTLLYKILNSGEYLKKAPAELLNQEKSSELIPYIAERGLRYDLTVPFARFVVMRQNEISFPFKRFQIQPVWRADRPQKGRYREFFQCDVDIVGSDSLIYEAELLCIYDAVLSNLKLPASIRINNRKVLQGVANQCNFGDNFRGFTTIIDKLDKIGLEEVIRLLNELGGNAEEAMKLLSQGQFNAEALSKLKSSLSDETALLGITELEEVLAYMEGFNTQNEILFDGTLARGLNYYTGTIYEVLAKGVKLGSIGGGGRYDDLTGIFGLKGVSGVGVSFGADRIYDAMLELDLFPSNLAHSATLLFCPMDDSALKQAFGMAHRCRSAGISCEVYPQAAKLKKQLGYANANSISFAVILGQDEMSSGKMTLKNLITGEQELVGFDELLIKISANS